MTDDEIELELTLEYIANGQADLEMEDYAGAEENFRHALEVTEENDFRERLDYGAGDIALMLTDCLMQQEKEEEALEILEPLANGTASFVTNDDASSQAVSIKGGPEHGLQFKACHILAVVFLKRLDFQAAEKRAKQAFKGRRHLLGAENPLTLESVQLIIDIYSAKDGKINARAYRRFLEPPAKSKRSPESVSSQATPGYLPAISDDSTNTHRMYVPVPKVVVCSDTSVRPGSFLPSGTVNVHTAVPVDRARPETDQIVLAIMQARGTGTTACLPRAPSQRLPGDVKSSPLLSTRVNNACSPSLWSPQNSSTSRIGVYPTQTTALAQLTEYEVIETAIHETAPGISTPNIEPDPLPPNIGVTSTSSRKKISWPSVFSRPSTTKSDSHVPNKADKVGSEAVTESSSRSPSVTRVDLSDQKQKESSPSIASRSLGVSTHPPARTRQELVPRFSSIRMLRQEGKKNAAIDSAMRLLKEYDPDRTVLLVREAELKKNMKESHKGMAGTGNGYAPIHFFANERLKPA